MPLMWCYTTATQWDVSVAKEDKSDSSQLQKLKGMRPGMSQAPMTRTNEERLLSAYIFFTDGTQ